MGSIRDIRKKISATKSTHKITRSMKIIAQIRFQKAQKQLLPLRPYSYRVRQFLMTILSTVPEEDIGKINYFGGSKITDSILVVFIASDKGLCGSFNSNLFKVLEAFLSGCNKKVKYIAVGQKGIAYLKRKNMDIYSSFTPLPAFPTIDVSRRIIDDCVKLYNMNGVSEIWLAYNQFVSASKSNPVVKKFLPMVPERLPIGTEIPQYLFEPEPAEILQSITPQYLKTAILETLFESALSEYCSRVIAMDSATNSAQKMISELMVKYHKLRQEIITKELIEVISGAEALK